MSKKGPTDTVASRDRVSGLIGSSSNGSKIDSFVVAFIWTRESHAGDGTREVVTEGSARGDGKCLSSPLRFSRTED